MEALPSETEDSQTDDQRWHQGHDEVAVRRSPRNGTGRDEAGEERQADGCHGQLGLRAIALSFPNHRPSPKG